MLFEMVHLTYGHVSRFTESTAPSWLTSDNSVPGSTMDYRWLWTEHVLRLVVGQSIRTDYTRITRIE